LDRSDLDRLVDLGLSGFPPSRLSLLAYWLWDWSRETGDARYSFLARSVEELADGFETDRVPTWLVERYDDVLRNFLPAVLRSETAAEGAHWASELAQALHRLPLV
jgi:hypothetical protein